MYTLTGKYTSALITIDDLEEEAVAQVTKLINQDIFDNKLAIMPDGHAGAGCVVGTTVPLGKRIVPNIVGVDIGCGILTTKIPQVLGINLESLDQRIKETVPMGFKTHESRQLHMEKDFPWAMAKIQIDKFAKSFNVKPPDTVDYRWFVGRCNKMGINLAQVSKALGTLGGGNHFIEIGTDSNNDKWLTVHTGSRNMGLKIANYHQKQAEKILKQRRESVVKQKLEKERASGLEPRFISAWLKQEYAKIPVTTKGLEYLEDENAAEYFWDMIIAQIYAWKNRRQIVAQIMNILAVADTTKYEYIESVHNYIDFSDGIVRKGAIRSYKGEKMIIPFNMRDGILICEGKSNEDWNFSSPHGAGRTLSRRAAREQLNLETFKAEMENIVSSSVCESTLDESPEAYKSADMIKKAIGPTATIIDTIKPILNIKAT